MRNRMYRFSFLLFFYLLYTGIAYAQDTSSLNLNTLTAPSSPGSVLLGVEPGDIQKPTDLNGLMMAVRNATNGFSKFPSSFSVDIAPWWLFGAKNITYNDFIGNKKTIAQTFNVSYAQDAQNDSNYYGLKQGIGLSFSLIRGSIIDSNYFSKVSSIRNILTDLLQNNFSRIQSLRSDDSTYQVLNRQYNLLLMQLSSLHNAANADSIAVRNSLLNEVTVVLKTIEMRDEQIRLLAKAYVDSLQSEEVNALQDLEQTLVPVRKGFFLNIAGGTIVSYGSYKASSGSFSNNAVWVNFGFDGIGSDSSGKSYVSVIALSRLTGKNNDELYKYGDTDKHTTWDNGIKVAYTTVNQKFSIGGEAISRKFFKVDEGKSFVFKYTVSIDWAVVKNARLSFVYGRDFSDHISKDGNVIGYVNFVKGLFNKKPVNRASGDVE